MVQWLKDEVTMSGAININLSDKEYNRIIEKELRKLYQIYPVTLYKTFMIIHLDVFRSPEFRRTRTI